MTTLSRKQIDQLAQRLATRRRELRAEVEAQLGNSDDPRAVGLKNELAATEDWVLADVQGHLEIAMVTRDIAELREVEAALTRIADGTYGNCSDCEQPIGWPRLDAYPTAQRCVACQQKLEARARHPGVASP